MSLEFIVKQFIRVASTNKLASNKDSKSRQSTSTLKFPPLHLRFIYDYLIKLGGLQLCTPKALRVSPMDGSKQQLHLSKDTSASSALMASANQIFWLS